MIKKWFDSKMLSYLELFDFFTKLTRNLGEDTRNNLIHALLTEVRNICSTTYFFVMLVLAILLDGKYEVVEENIIRNIIIRLMVKPYSCGMVWLIRELSKHQKYEAFCKKVGRFNPNLNHLIVNVINFVSESHKTLENYL